MTESSFKILLVEDDDALRYIIKDNLAERNYEVTAAENGEVALEKYEKEKFDLILLDVMLPRVDGFRVAEIIRNKDEQTPIIFLTARSMTEDKIKGLTLGGDDYIPKPFSMEELLLKIRIFLKRSQVSSQEKTETSKGQMAIGQYLFDPDELTLIYDGEIRTLTLKEAELIRFFARNSNKVLSRNEILEKVWGSNDYFLGRSLDVFISRLRKYFSLDPHIKITNLHGIGFRFSVKEK